MSYVWCVGLEDIIYHGDEIELQGSNQHDVVILFFRLIQLGSYIIGSSTTSSKSLEKLCYLSKRLSITQCSTTSR